MSTRQHDLFEDLPRFEGDKPIGTELSLSGAVGRRTRPMKIGDSLVLVVEVEVTGVNHKQTKGGILRAHALKVMDAYELGDGRAPDLLEALHTEYEQAEREARDAAANRVPLPFDGPDAAEAAAGAGPEARADERDGIGWDEFDPMADPDLLALSDAADLVALGGQQSRDEFLAEVALLAPAEDDGLEEVDLGEVPPHAGEVLEDQDDDGTPSEADAATVTD